MDELVGYLLNYGVLGIMVLLFLTGLIVAKPTLDALRADRDAWRDAYQTEAAGHAATRAALAEANGRSEVAVETAKTATSLLASLGHHAAPTTEGPS